MDEALLYATRAERPAGQRLIRQGTGIRAPGDRILGEDGNTGNYAAVPPTRVGHANMSAFLVGHDSVYPAL